MSYRLYKNVDLYLSTDGATGVLVDGGEYILHQSVQSQ